MLDHASVWFYKFIENVNKGVDIDDIGKNIFVTITHNFSLIHKNVILFIDNISIVDYRAIGKVILRFECEISVRD